MNCEADHISYAATRFFSKLVVDYLSQADELKPFYSHPVSLEGIKAAVEERKKYPTNRKLLLAELKKQYAGIPLTEKQRYNLEQLDNSNTFTVTTAHQPNIFTGHLYFIYKILHAVRLAEQLRKEIPGNHFVPVFYMGSEDADLAELGHIYLFGEKHEWKTKQRGAVGRMKVDKELIQLIAAISGQLLVLPHGEEIINLIKDCYVEGETIERATFKFINTLFGEYGLVVLLPDNAALKTSFIPVVEKELATSFSYGAVAATAAEFPKAYKMQAGGREINLFYLLEDIRERIVSEYSKFKVQNSGLEFTDSAISEELHHFPERFSPNVILRPVYQEMILPNVAFIGGGGEIAYWLELKRVFESVKVPFPVLVLRNSFLIVEEDQAALIDRLGFGVNDLFRPEDELLNELVKQESGIRLSLDQEKLLVKDIFNQLKNTAGAADITLQKHTESLQAQALKKIDALEKKMLRAEKKKFEAQKRQLQKLVSKLFPDKGLQERVENFMPYYAKWGADFINMIYENALGLEQEFTILREQISS